MRVLNEHTSAYQLERYVEEISVGQTAVVLTDGGSPAISDPGTQLTDACHLAGIEVTAIPGPSAVPTAIALSGFFGQRFAFLGFLGRKAGAIRDELEPYIDSPMTLVFFESPFRIDAFLKVVGGCLGERRYAICREMSKMHEQVFRATLPTVPSETEVPRKGEFTIVIEGKRRRA